MPVSTMDQQGADKFDGKKAYQAQEEDGIPFVSLGGHVVSECSILTTLSSSTMGERSNYSISYTVIRL